MSPLAVLITLALLAVVVLVVTGPLRARAGTPPQLDAERADLEAAREAKYREIRDCELDFRTGKLSERDYETIDAQLRAEALAILDRLQALDPDAQARGAATPRDA